MEPIELDYLVVGGGVLGLAVLRQLAPRGSAVLVEQNARLGAETSSRNSEVIHSGIYYPSDSLKTRLCLRGRQLLYEYLADKAVPFRRTGKWVVAAESAERERLAALFSKAESLGVPVQAVSRQRVETEAPFLRVAEVVEFPESGIFDSEGFLRALRHEAEDSGATILLQHRFVGAERTVQGWACSVVGPDQRVVSVRATNVVNAAGLEACAVRQGVSREREGAPEPSWRHRFCQGRYFSLRRCEGTGPGRLIYPLPPLDGHGLGVHVTIDLSGAVRFGPDVAWLDDSVPREAFYQAPWESLTAPFARAIQRYWPAIQESDLLPHQVGVRPKLFFGSGAVSDFRVEHYDGMVSLLGMESPGLTASLAIAEEVGKQL